jgi:hypothetical protein
MVGFGASDDIVIKISSDIKEALVGIRKVDVAIDKMDANVGKAAAGIRGATGKMVKSFSLLGVVATAAIGGISLVMSKQAGDMEAYMTTLEQLYGSQEVAAEKMKWLLDFAKRTPFELPGLIEATIKLKAYGIDAENVLKGLGDTASAMGKPINMAVEALADAQTGEFERLKEFGIKAVQITAANAEKLGVDMAAIGETALTSTDKFGKQRVDIIDRNNREVITSTLMSIWNDKFAGGMAKQATTLKGMVSNIKDTMFQASLSIMGFDASIGAFRPDSLFVKVKGVVDNVLTYINQIDFETVAAKVEETVNKIVGYLTKLYEDLAPTWDNLQSIFVSIQGIVGDVFGAFASGESGTMTLTDAINTLTGALAKVFAWIDKHPGITKLAVTIGLAAVAFAYIVPIVASVASAVGSLMLFVGSLATAIGGATSVIGAISAVIAVLGGPITVIIALVALLAAAWTTNFFGIRDKTKTVVEFIKKLFLGMVNFLGPLVVNWINSYIKVFNFLIPFLNKAGLNLNEIAELQFTKLEQTVADTATSIESSTEDITDAVKQVETDIDQSVSGAAASYKELGDVSTAASEELTMSMVKAGVSREDLAKRAEEVASGIISPTAMIQAMPGQIGTEPVVRMVDEQKESNRKLEQLDKLENLSTLSEISTKLDSLKIEVNNYVTNVNRSSSSRSSSGGGSLVDSTKDAAETSKNIVSYNPIITPKLSKFF